jgi:hypothetical protein
MMSAIRQLSGIESPVIARRTFDASGVRGTEMEGVIYTAPFAFVFARSNENPAHRIDAGY